MQEQLRMTSVTDGELAVVVTALAHFAVSLAETGVAELVPELHQLTVELCNRLAREVGA